MGSRANRIPPLVRLAVTADFSLQPDPHEDVKSDLIRTYRIAVMARSAEESSDTACDDIEEIQVGTIHIQHLRFDVVINLGYDPQLIADDVSADALTIYESLQAELGDMSDGMHQDCLLVSRFSFEHPYRGTSCELNALRTAIIGLSSGVSRAFLPMGVVIPTIARAAPKERNATTLYFDKIGFKPLKLGSDILWLDMEMASLWNE